MLNPQLYPLEVNPHTGEPFLVVNHHKNIILTPPRITDIVCFPPILNDPRVWKWLVGPPVPYTLEDAEAWYASTHARSEAVLRELDEARDESRLITVNECPVRAVREVRADGEEVYLGDIVIDRCTDGKVMSVSEGVGAGTLSEAEMEQYAKRNVGREVGDPEIIWDLGCYLTPSLHGQGIMTEVMLTLLSKWLVPRMGMRRMLVTIFPGNSCSMRALQKIGFVLKKAVENYEEVRGKMADFNILEWNLQEVQIPSKL